MREGSSNNERSTVERGAGQGGVGGGRAEGGVRAQGRAAVIGISQGESMRNDLSGREVQEWSEPSRDGLQGAEGGARRLYAHL